MQIYYYFLYPPHFWTFSVLGPVFHYWRNNCSSRERERDQASGNYSRSFSFSIDFTNSIISLHSKCYIFNPSVQMFNPSLLKACERRKIFLRKKVHSKIIIYILIKLGLKLLTSSSWHVWKEEPWFLLQCFEVYSYDDASLLPIMGIVIQNVLPPLEVSLLFYTSQKRMFFKFTPRILHYSPHYLP